MIQDATNGRAKSHLKNTRRGIHIKKRIVGIPITVYIDAHVSSDP